MIVLNKEKRILILGDGRREGNKLFAGTRIDPGQSVSIDDIPPARRERFLAAVKRAVNQGKGIEILDAPVSRIPDDQAAELKRREQVAALDKLALVDAPAPAPAPAVAQDPAPNFNEPARRRRGRPRKHPKPLGG